MLLLNAKNIYLNKLMFCRSSKNFTSNWNITYNEFVDVKEDEMDSGKFIANLTGAVGSVYWNATLEMLRNQVS